MGLTPAQRALMLGLRALVAAAVIALAAGPAYLDIVGLRFFADVFSMLVLAMMWNLLAGYADIVTVGQQAFVGVGAYALYGFAVKMGLSLPIAILAAGFLSFLISIPVMVVVFRLRAAYLAIGTWVVAEVFTLVAAKLPGFGGATGVGLPGSVIRAVGATVESRFSHLYWLTFGLAVIAFVATGLLLRSRFGIGLTAMRDNEEAAGAIGVNLVRARIVSFLWAGLFLGLAGALYTLQNLMIEPDASFSLIDYTVYVIFAVVIGGIGSIEGSIIGVLIYIGLRNVFTAYGNLYLIFLGVISIVVMLAEPRGIWGLIRYVLPEDIILVSHRYRPRRAKAR
ncbi:MAG: branched-chain amino acid ABC transporter permease [Stellaceae bacterium]